MAKFKTHYDSLNVSRNAPLVVIRAAYKVLCQNYHPDKYAGGHDEALRIMKIINGAYAILSDSGKRAAHDQWIDKQERECASHETLRIANIISKAYVAPQVKVPKAIVSHPEKIHKLKIHKLSRYICLIGDKLRFLVPGLRSRSMADSGINNRQNNRQNVKKPALKKISWFLGVAGIIGILGAITYFYEPRLKATLPVNPDVAVSLTQARQWLELGQFAKALPLYLQLAKQGNADAQFNTGLIYANGQGIVKDNKQAVDWLGKAAAQGHKEAQSKLGFMYATGKGVKQNDSLAIYWCYKAAEQGDVVAQFHLGLMYEKGQGVAKDNSLAFSWYSKAAAQGHAQAQYNLDVMYSKGDIAAKAISALKKIE